MSLISVDVEADGPIPGDYSMICFGAIVVESSLKKTFYGKLKPISEKWVPEALAISGFSREETLEFPEPVFAMQDFAKWLAENSKGRPIFIADNNGFDWSFINWYFHHFTNSNPFGFSSRRIGDLYCGLERNFFAKWKHLRKTKHSHHPVEDAKGNAEVMLDMQKAFGVKFE